jgi:hypothetical protein
MFAASKKIALHISWVAVTGAFLRNAVGSPFHHPTLVAAGKA